MWSMRRSNRTGGRVCGVDMVIIAEMLGLGSRAVATIPPIEWPMTMIDVSVGYSDRTYSIARAAYAVSESIVGPWNAERSSLYSTRYDSADMVNASSVHSPAKKSRPVYPFFANSGDI